MSTVLITGVTGLIGTALFNKLRGKVKVIGTTRKIVSLQAEENEFIKIDLIEDISVGLITSLNPDIIIHCAANIPSLLNSDNEAIAVKNNLIDKNIFNAINKINSKLIYFSTTLIYNQISDNRVIDETFPINSESEYARQKIESETYINENIEEALILRVNAPYGAKSKHETVLTKFIRNAKENRPLFYYGTGARTQDFTHVDDIASLLLELIKRKHFVPGTFNISSGAPISMKNLAFMIVKTLGSKSKILKSDILDPQESYRANYDTKKSRQFLGWNPKVSLEKGIYELAQLI